jgi:hypothetical protein
MALNPAVGERTRGAVVIILVLICALSAAPAAQQPRATLPAPAAPKSSAPKDWPDAQTMQKKQQEAENRPLFSSATPLAFTLTANFKAINNDRAPTSTKTFPATMQFTRDDGSAASVELQVRTRGHVRRGYGICGFAPLRLELPKTQMKGTVFDGQNALKLGTHCRDGVAVFEQYVLREYAAYRISNLITPRSFRARLAKATYVDAATKKPLSTRYAMFLEDDDDVAARLGGRVIEQRDALSGLDRDAFTLMTLFEYLIGNLDMSIIEQHNVRLVQMQTRKVYPVPYDFDYSGLVDATYALPPPGLGITTVRDRLYRGPCRTAAEFETFFTRFRAVRPDIAALYDSLPDFDAGAKKKSLAYIDQFYRVIDRPDEIKTAFLEHCLKKGLMSP